MLFHYYIIIETDNLIEGRAFERINNHYELTTLGQELLLRAKEIENNFHNLERQIISNHLKSSVKTYNLKAMLK